MNPIIVRIRGDENPSTTKTEMKLFKELLIIYTDSNDSCQTGVGVFYFIKHNKYPDVGLFFFLSDNRIEITQSIIDQTTVVRCIFT